MPRWRDPIQQTKPGKLALLLGIDLRTLALLRVGLAAIILCDLGVRATALVAHYTDRGILPRSALALIDSHPFEKVAGQWHLSLHQWSGELWWQAFLFALAAIFAAGMLVGFRTRLCNVVSWVLLVSLQVRNPLVVYGGDHLLRLLLFWGMFLPLGERWSLDERRGRHGRRGRRPSKCSGDANRGAARPREPRVPARQACSVASAALLLQVCLVYWCTAALKTGEAWRVTGTAVQEALQADLYVTAFGKALLNYPGLLRGVTHFIWWFEVLGPLGLLLSFRTGRIRTGVIALFLLMHLAMGLSLELGIFPWVSALSVLVFLPTSFWERFSRVQPLRPPVMDRGLSGFGGLAAACCLAIVVWWNLETIAPRRVRVPLPIRAMGQLLRLDQAWTMFAPYPLQDDGWYVMPALLEDGSVLDLARAGRGEVTWQKPRSISSEFPNHRWRKYMIRLRREPYHKFLPFLGAYLCCQWDTGSADLGKLEKVDIVFMLEPVQGAPPQRLLLFRQTCGD